MFFSCRDSINLLSPDERLVANVAWDQSYKGMVIQRGSDGKFKVLNERLDILAKLEALGNFSHFLNALNVSTRIQQATYIFGDQGFMISKLFLYIMKL